MGHKRIILIAIHCCICCFQAMAIVGLDSVDSKFFREQYQTTDLAHYLDNNNVYVVYEAETTGEWSNGDQHVFSIAGNSFKNSKYVLNGMRIDSRSRVGSMLLHTGMDRTSMALDYHDGILRFADDTIQHSTIRLTGNTGNMGGISPGTRQLINLFHESAEERTIDNRPVNNRNHVVGAGTAETTFAINYEGKPYYQHAYFHYVRRRLTAFDHTGISGMYNADGYTAQVDGRIPLSTGAKLESLNYFMVATGRTDYGSEFLYNQNEQGKHNVYHAGVYATKRFANQGTLVAGISYELSQWKHDTLQFSRNIMDHDGEGFEPWYADGNLHSINLSVQYDQRLLPWLRIHAEGYNALLHFNPTIKTWSNDMYMQAFNASAPTYLNTINWTSSAFTGGLLENEALAIAEHCLARGLTMYAHLGVSLDGILLEDGQSVVTPNWLAKFALDYKPCGWFNISLSISHHRMSYTWDELRYLSTGYMNHGARHQPAATLWMHQPSYAVLDLPIRFTWGRTGKHEVAVLSTIRKYYNQWYTTRIEGSDDYRIGLQPMDVLSDQLGKRTPYLLSNCVRYTYTGRKWFVQLSWQSYLMSGFSALGNGPLSNNIGILSESTADPRTHQTIAFSNLPYQGTGRLNQDRAYIARLQVTYNACKYFSIGLSGKFKDGQAFTNFEVQTQTNGSQTQATILPYDARGINTANNAFGKRKDAFFNFDLRATGRWWVREIPMSLEVQCYNIYDFGTALTEYTFDRGYDIPARTTMSMCIPRGLLFTLRIGLEKDQL